MVIGLERVVELYRVVGIHWVVGVYMVLYGYRDGPRDAAVKDCWGCVRGL